jgi:hypothetical protein
MTTSKKLLLNMYFAIIGLILIITISYFTAAKNINLVMENDLESIVDSLENMILLKAEKEPLAYKDEEFKKAIKSIKIGKTGYVYLIDKEGKLIIHPNKEGVSLINEEFIQKIVSDKKGGLISYYAETTNQNKIVAYRYIPKWDMWVVPGINKGDNEQAASLEETAAALEEITSITRNNTQNATKMATLGQVVKKSVLSGEELASKTASSMDEINEKVKAINSAITVIDQIAFQTNILSLNAAVEAATAGEAGKGFAVVAQEVRNLANRSAEAAKEIKNLVEEANIKTNDGKLISSDMIEGYKELNKNISETINIIEDVSAASKEQMLGIEQINQTVNMLDRVTQENAFESNQIKEISQSVSTLAYELLTDAKSKKFN